MNDHVHALLVTHDDHLLAVVERGDLASAAAEDLVRTVGRLAGRVVAASDDLAEATQAMDERGCRRLAVVDHNGRLAGLLCRKRSRTGFCSDDGVMKRAAEQHR